MKQLQWTVMLDLKPFVWPQVFFFWDRFGTSPSSLVLSSCFYLSISKEIYIFPLCALFRLAGLQTHIGGLLLEGSVPLNCYMALLALCLFITIVKALACVPPPLQNLYKNISERLSQGSAMPWQHLRHYRLLPASETISCSTQLCGETTKESLQCWLAMFTVGQWQLLMGKCSLDLEKHHLYSMKADVLKRLC